MEEKTWRSTSYSNEFANIQGNTKKIGVHCNWYTAKQGELETQEVSTHGYIDIMYYRMTIPTQFYYRQKHCLSNNVYKKIKNYL